MGVFGDNTNFGLDGAMQQIKDAAGITSPIANKADSSQLPWVSEGVSPSASKFFSPIQIDGTRWDQLYPYRLMVIDVTKKNAVVGGTADSRLVTNASNGGLLVEVVGSQAGTSIIAFEAIKNTWIFNLPITPQQLNIVDQFAITTSATLRGVLEEHNGIKFKLITASGSLGVWPFRQSVTHPPTTPNVLQSLFGGTLNAIGNVVGSVTKLVNTITTSSPANKPPRLGPDTAPNGLSTTGYYQALALQQFLEQYAEAKKLPANAGWRLIFDIPKQNQSYIVTPMQYVWQQSADKAMEIKFSMQLKAWRRIDISVATANALPDITVGPGILQRVLNSITAARQVASASIDLIGAVRSDVETPLTVLRQTALFVKDLAGVAVTAADLPSQIAKDYQSSISASIQTAGSALSQNLTSGGDASKLSALNKSSAQREGLSSAAVAGGQLGSAAANSQSIDPSNNVFSSPEKNFNLFNQVNIDSMNLTVAQQNKVDQIIEEARQITVDDLKKFRATILGLALQLSNNFGAGDAFYSKVYNKPAPSKRIQPITLNEYDILKAFYDSVQGYDLLTSTTQLDDQRKQTNMEYVAGLADQSNILFNTTQAKTLAPVPFGLTIEAIAQRYLNDKNRWLEIATLNNLREPYIDENGFQLSLLSNATGRQITVGTNTNLYIGQKVVIMSAGQLPSGRRIIGIDRLSDTSFLITLDGLPNLDNFLVSDRAFLQAYLPGTVNSQQKIFIPSDLPVPTDPHIVVPSSTISDPLTGLSKVDWLLTDSGDVAINNYGDFRLSYGMTNIIQALRIKLGTQKGTWLIHPEFGFGVRVGTSLALVNIQDLFVSIKGLIIQDPRFQGLSSLQITINGPTLSISLAVVLAGQNGVFPVTFQLPSQ